MAAKAVQQRSRLQAIPVAERLLAYADVDRMVRLVLGSGHMWIGGQRLMPSSLDAAACAVARGLVTDDCSTVAVAFPRGRGPHPALLGLYLTLWRHAIPHLCGSLVVSTARGELSKSLRDLMYDAAEFSELTVGRLVTQNVPNTGGVDIHGNPQPPRKRAAIRPLDRTPRRGISQKDGYLLFVRPNSLPPVADNVVWAMVVDTVGTAGPRPFSRPDAEPDSWTRTLNANICARRKQLWVGELEDPDFKRFCAENRIPLVTFDWPLIEQLTELGGDGAGSLTAGALVMRARRRPPVAYRVVEDQDRDYLAREVYTLLSKLRQRGGDSREPAVVKTAYKLCGLLCRLPCTKQAYDAATGGGFAETIERMWKSVDNARSSAFIGWKWKDGFKRYWDPIRSSLRKLIRLQEDEDTCSKYVALIERLGQAQAAGECVRIICQTNAERNAVKATLREYGVTEKQATVHSFGARFELGPKGKLVTLLVGPPPPWRGSILVSGEEGRVEVLCYPHEVARVRARVQEAERSHETENAEALNALGLGARSEPSEVEQAVAPEELPGYEVGSDAEPDEWAREVPPADSTLWQQLLASFGQELPDPDSSDDAETTVISPTSPYDGFARLVRFTDAPPVFFRNDAELDVLLDEVEEDDSLTVSVPVAELEEGMTVAFLPGGQRSLVEVLLAAYDQRLHLEAKMFEPLWRSALAAALANEGLEGLAALTDRTTAAVRSWLSGRNIPQQPWRFKKVLEASGDPEALRAQQPLWQYLTATRGPHRRIGQLNRLAIAEAARDDRNQQHLRELERYIGADLEDLYDQVEPVTVMSVSAPVAVPLAHCGRYLPDDDPYLRSCP
jgi:hypothetical protein